MFTIKAKNIMTKFNPLQILIDGFNKLVSTVKRNGALTSLWAVVIFIVLYTLVINPINVNEIIIQTNKQKDIAHSESVNKRLIADEVMGDILDKLRIKYGIDRVCLLEMHNSTSSINELSFLFFSLTYESVDAFNDSIPLISEQYQQTRTSEYSSVLKECARKGYLYLNIEQAKQDARFARLARKLEINGAKSIMFFPLFNGKRLDALLVFSSTKDNFNYQDILMNVNKSAAKIKSLIFNEIVL